MMPVARVHPQSCSAILQLADRIWPLVWNMLRYNTERLTVYSSGGVYIGYWSEFPVLNQQSCPARPNVVEIWSALSMGRERWLPWYNTESLISRLISKYMHTYVERKIISAYHTTRLMHKVVNIWKASCGFGYFQLKLVWF